jgi:hypothetical protein
VTVATGQVWYLYRVRGAVEPRLYIGITSQSTPYARLQQHVGGAAGNVAGPQRGRPKWWAPLATGWDLDHSRPFYTEADALRAEAKAIRAERPRCNVVHNQGNPDRWRSMADVPLAQRPRVPVGMAPGPSRTPVRAGRRFWNGHRAGVASVVVIWLAAYLSLEWLVHNAGAAAVGTGLAFWWTWRNSGRRRARRGRR